MAESPEPDDPLDEAFAAYLRTCDAGELTDRGEFLTQFPELAGQLEELMDAADLIGQVTMSGATPKSDTKAGPNAETIQLSNLDGDESADDVGATLPIANRPAGDPGPTLPFDLGDYQLLEVIGRGGMGVVYVAQQTHLDRMVAVKMIRSGIFADESEVRRFYTEAQAAARLHHPGIVAVHQFGKRAGHHFFSMEYVDGTDLQRMINLCKLDPREAARYVRDVARAIDHAHANGVLHRDLKPANVLIDSDDQVHVTDFGLAKHLDADSSVTGSGAAIGTPHYMAPEQAGGHSHRSTHRSDVYSLGALLFACVTGKPPIVGDTVMQTLLQVVHQPPPLLRSVCADAPADLETIVSKCLEKVPSKRYQSAKKLADDLDAYLQGRPIQARPRSGVIKAWHWLEGVPLVGAVSGRRALEASVSHRRFQTGMLLLLLLMPFFIASVAVAYNHWSDQMPTKIRVAGGLEGGVYNTVSDSIAKRLAERHDVDVEVIHTSGSVDNRRRLLESEVDMAPMQASAINGDELCVIAPLFYEAVHVLARADSTIYSVNDLKGHHVAVGPEGSGSRLAAELVFSSLEFTPQDCPRDVIAWPDLQLKTAPDAAIVCIGRGSALVSDLLSSQRWRLVPIDEAVAISLQHPTLSPMKVSASEYPSNSGIPAGGIATVGTTAFLAARHDAPKEMVLGVLNALYRTEFAHISLIPRKQVAEWQGLAFHPAAHQFFSVDTE